MSTQGVRLRAMAVSRPALLGLAGTLAALAVPSTASAAAVVAGQKCARSGTASFNMITSGWSPGSSLTIHLGSFGRTVTADGAGVFSTAGSPLTAPLLSRPGVKTLSLTVSDGTTTAGPVKTKVVRRGVRVPSHAKPAQVVRYRGFGFPLHKRLYLHVRRGGSTKGTFRMGRPSGACGLVTRRLRYMPLRRWSTGTYDYWFSNTRTFRRSRTLYGYRINIYRRFG
jgi:hypothetical protein